MELINITYKNKTNFALEPLTAERFRELWSRTYNTNVLRYADGALDLRRSFVASQRRDAYMGLAVTAKF